MPTTRSIGPHVVATVALLFGSGTIAGRAAASDVAMPSGLDGVVRCEAPAGPEVAKPSGIDLSGAITVQVVNPYLYRGFLTEEKALIVQSWLDLHAKIPLGGGIESVDVHGQFWNSFSDGVTGTGGPNDEPKAWAEADWTLGVTTSFAGGFSIDLSYQQLRAPNGNFNDLDEVSVTIAYDDSGAHGGPGLFRGWHPSLNLVVETLGKEDLSNERGTYLGVGIAPTFAAWEDDGAPTIAIPILTGWSLGHYYEDEAGDDHAFGFLDVGVDLTAPLGESAWTLKLSAHALFLGDTPTEFAGDRDFFAVFAASLSFAF